MVSPSTTRLKVAGAHASSPAAEEQPNSAGGVAPATASQKAIPLTVAERARAAAAAMGAFLLARAVPEFAPEVL